MTVRAAIAFLLLGSAPPLAHAQSTLKTADRTAAFQAAGFKLVGKQWRSCDDPGSMSYTPGQIDAVRDLTGDGLPEAIISEGSTACFGMTGTGFALVSKQANGKWKSVVSETGIPTFLATKGTGGWPDIEVGGPGFCFPVLRWNGKNYVFNRRQYEGKACR